MKTMSIEDFRKEGLKRFGDKLKNWRFICPVCSTIQSGEDLHKAGIDKDKVQDYLGFSCIGRWTDAGPYKDGDPPGKGCNWTLGGLIRIHKLEIRDNNGDIFPHMEFAPEEENKIKLMQEFLNIRCIYCGSKGELYILKGKNPSLNQFWIYCSKPGCLQISKTFYNSKKAWEEWKDMNKPDDVGRNQKISGAP